MHSETTFLALFAVATAVALVARRLRVPYTVALVVAGLLLGSTHAFQPPHLTKDLLYAVFLPGLVYEAAFHVEYRHFLRNKLSVLALAVPGVVFATLLTAALLVPVCRALGIAPGFALAHAVVFGALVSATDPIAVVAIFKALGAPKRLGVLVEGESLLNDGTAVVVFGLALSAAVGPGRFDAAPAAIEFARVVGMGVLVGAVVGYLGSKVIQQVDDPMIEITVTTITAYGSFAAAEHLHDSGVIATVTAGMLCGNYAARTGMSPSTRVAAETFWEYAAFALNSLVFLLIGFEVRLSELVASWQAILAAWIAVTVGRAAVTAIVTLALRRTSERIPWSWAGVLTWGGLRGGLSMVLVLSLPADFAHRELLVNMTFGVVLVSILVQGLTMAPVLRRLGVTGARHERLAYEAQRAELIAARAGLAAIDGLSRDHGADADALAVLRDEYLERAKRVEERMRDLHAEIPDVHGEEARRARRHLLLAERAEVMRAFREGLVGQEALERALADIDARRVDLEAEDDPAHAA
jgi:CPA1 family monovalent cation:H+ antiporter